MPYKEEYLPDPALESTMRVVQFERGGVWHVFRNDGREYVYDTLAELAEDYAEMIAKHFTAKA